MSLAGFKKQLNKANQFMSEKIGGARGTELDDEFVEMEKKVDVIGKVVDELMVKTQELLQPNPASRAKMAAVKSISKIRGQANQTLYPQPEGQLGDCMIKYGKDLGDDSLFGQALMETGESYKQLAEVKYSLEDQVKQNFIEPLTHLQNKDIKEVNHHRKKLSGRRLDYDCKKRKQRDGAQITEEDIRTAEEKFEESKQLTETAMTNLLENDTEQVSQLLAFVEAELTYHQNSASILQTLVESLRDKCNQAASRPRREHVPKRAVSMRSTGSDRSIGRDSYDTSESGYKSHSTAAGYSASSSTRDPFSDENLMSLNQEPLYSAVNKPARSGQAMAEALYDFEPENEGELGFKEGDKIALVSRIDENWLEGRVGGQTGYFPVTYVKILVDLPH